MFLAALQVVNDVYEALPRRTTKGIESYDFLSLESMDKQSVPTVCL